MSIKLWFCILLICILALPVKDVFSQSSVTSQTIDLFERIPSSPNAGALNKYLQFPVNLASGSASISIPIYTITAGGIKIPISLSYNTSGIKVAERSPWVGAGWTLNTVGAINKRVNGHDDIYAHIAYSVERRGPNYPYMASNYSDYITGFGTFSDFVDSMMTTGTALSLDPQEIQSFLGRIPNNQIDAEADEFMFSTPEGGGMFFYSQKEQQFISDKPVAWSVILDSDTTFILTSKSGVDYFFDLKERTVNPLYGTVGGSSLVHLLNAYYPTYIQDVANQTAVSITYENFYSNAMVGRSMYHDYQGVFGSWYNFGSATTDIYREGDEYTITSILFPEGKVLFVKDTATRQDEGPKPLKEIQIYNERNILIKKYVLDYFYTTAGVNTYCNYATKRLFLKSILEIDYTLEGTEIIRAPYEFTYYNDNPLPCFYSLAQDFWGYYNGKVSNSTLIPTFSWYGALGIPTEGDREVDTVYSISGSLKTVTYQTGGSALFEYQNNRTDVLVGGLRVKKITYTDSLTSKAMITEYEYKNDYGTSSGMALYNPVFNYQYLFKSGPSEVRVIRLESDPVYPLFPNQGSPVLYSTVLEKQLSDSGEQRIRHHYSTFWAYANESYQNMCCGVPHNKFLLRSDLIGKEYKTEYFRKESNGSFSRIKVDSLVFSPVTAGRKYTWNVQGSWATVMEDWIVWPGNDPYSTVPLNLNPAINAYKFVQQDVLPATTFSTIYENGELLRARTSLSYDSLTSEVVESKSVSSEGDTTIRLVKYAANYISAGTWPSVNYEIKVMKEQNKLSAPIEMISAVKKKNAAEAIVTEAILYEYKDLNVQKVYKFFGSVPLDEFTISYNDASAFYKDNRYVLDQEVVSFDGSRRPQTVNGRQKKVSYLWNDIMREPTAVVSEADLADIAQSSFESLSNASWTVSSSVRDSSQSVTGRKCYSLGNGNVSKSGLTSGKEYIVTCWVKNGSGTFNVNGTPGMVLESKGGWNLISKKVTGVTTITVSGAATIDELRLIPVGAQMQTFNYDSVLGVTDICDTNNQVLRYVYEGSGKLSRIVDLENNIIKKIAYQYRD